MRFAVAAALMLLAGGAVAEESDLDAAFEKGVLVIQSSRFACYRLDVYLAKTDWQHARGLMHVRHLPLTTGMFFIYESDAYLSMWMKNTYLPLDMVFARADGQVSSVAYDTEPLSLQSVVALEPVRYVLELNAGVAEKLGIDKYSRLLWDADEQ